MALPIDFRLHRLGGAQVVLQHLAQFDPLRRCQLGKAKDLLLDPSIDKIYLI
jgi:hypothetical protein